MPERAQRRTEPVRKLSEWTGAAICLDRGAVLRIAEPGAANVVQLLPSVRDAPRRHGDCSGHGMNRRKKTAVGAIQSPSHRADKPNVPGAESSKAASSKGVDTRTAHDRDGNEQQAQRPSKPR